MNPGIAAAADFAAWLKRLTPEQIAYGNELERERVAAEHADFTANHANGICYVCRDTYTAFDPAKPCIHWLLRPPGLKKHHLLAVFAIKGYRQVSAYLRWLANTENLFGNINDLSEEHRAGAVFAETIRYKQLEWSFVCQPADHAGHPESAAGATPHYHMRMQIDGRPFVDYNDFHLPLSEMDLFEIEMLRQHADVMVEERRFSAGMDTLLNAPDHETLLTAAKPATEESAATLHVQTIIEAGPGIVITEGELAALIAEAKEKDVLVTTLVSKLGHRVTRIIEPAPSVPAPAERHGRHSKGKNTKPTGAR